MDVRPFFNIYGIDTSKKWPAQRIQNEVTALELIREKTTIPVPQVLDVGLGQSQNGDGASLTVERVDGIELNKIKETCRQAPHGRVPDGHTLKNCTACQAIANRNAERFITDIMLPQLKSLTSSQTGLNGIVIPPPWVTEYDRRETWSSKTSTQQSFVFCHGDLGPQNLMCDPVTLEILHVVDWENAGYLEEEFLHIWAVDRDTYLDLYNYSDQLARQIALLG